MTVTEEKGMAERSMGLGLRWLNRLAGSGLLDRIRMRKQVERALFTVVEELADGAVVVELPYAGTSWLVREILRGAGDLVVLEPDEAREAIAAGVAASAA